MQAIGRIFGGALLTALLLQAGQSAPVLNKPQLEKYLRYAEGFNPDVHFRIEDPTAGPFPGFYRVLVHLTTDAGGKLDRVYYVTPDGEKIVNGAIWDVNMSPFADSLAHLPHDGYSFGPEDAKVQMVIFSDFQCPYCKEFAKTVRTNLAQKYPKDVRVVFEDFPIDSLHPWARAAAEDSHCLGDEKQGEFWTFHDWIFEHQAEIKKETLRDKVLGFAKDQNLDVAKVQACMDKHDDAAVVNQHIAAGQQLQVQQTPSVFINGRLVAGALPWPSLDSVIQLELNRPSSIPTGAAACCQIPMPVVGKK